MGGTGLCLKNERVNCNLENGCSGFSLLCEQMLEDVGFENVQAEDQTMQVSCSQVYTKEKI